MGAIGIALWVAPSSADTIWPWLLTPLTARAVGSFLIGFAAAAAFAALDNRVERLRGAAYAYATLGALELLAAAVFGEHFDDGGERALRGVRGHRAAGRAGRAQPPCAARSAASADSRS